jgi:hypothetical protein
MSKNEFLETWYDQVICRNPNLIVSRNEKYLRDCVGGTASMGNLELSHLPIVSVLGVPVQYDANAPWPVFVITDGEDVVLVPNEPPPWPNLQTVSAETLRMLRIDGLDWRDDLGSKVYP